MKQKQTRSILDQETTWRIHDDARTALLIDGRDYYRAFYEAAMRAKKSILLLGWQFDSDVPLVRGDDLPKGVSEKDVTLLALLERLARERPELQVRILAWDYSVFFALEREILQELYFSTATSSISDRFAFRWDNSVPFGGSHHQKVAIVDGRIAFFGSQDICQERWDESSHSVNNPLRISRGAFHQPYHEVQVALFGGDAPRSMLDLFIWRWKGVTGEELDRERLISTSADDVDAAQREEEPFPIPVTLAMPPARIGFARTIPEVEGRAHVDEIAKILVRSIETAEELVYIETQYLTSCAVRDALLARMRDAARPKLGIVVILPFKPEKLKEEMTVGIPQATLLQTLRAVAKEHGHSLGIYNVLAGHDAAQNEALWVYIHSKLIIVDDRIFVVGSANFTNRSMLIDSEIVAAYEAAPDNAELVRAIRRVRVRLLMEHIGEKARARDVVLAKGLVERLDAMVASKETRLRAHDIDEPNAIAKVVHDLTLEFLDPQTRTSKHVREQAAGEKMKEEAGLIAGNTEACPPAE